MICAVCGGDISRNGTKQPGGCTASLHVELSGPASSSKRHTDQELLIHMRTALVQHGYPDPWRER